MEPDMMRLLQIFQDNSDVPFIERLRNRTKYPVINNPDGSYSTHKLSYMTTDRGAHVFPTIVWDGKGLQELPPKEAFERAKKTNDMLTFPTREEADWFGQNYKRVYGIK